MPEFGKQRAVGKSSIEQPSQIVQLINSNEALLAEHIKMSKAKQQYMSAKKKG